MKLYYIAHARIPTEKAHGVHIMKMCEAFAGEGNDVTLLVPKRKNEITENPFAYYGVEEKFAIKYVPMLDLVGNPLFYWISQLSFSLSLLFQKIEDGDNVAVFSRDIFSAFLLSFRNRRVFFDIHGFPEQSVWFWKYVLGRMKGVVLTNKQKLERAKTILKIPEDKLLVHPNGYDPKLFDIKKNKDELRKELGLPDGTIAMYTGHLYSWKGATVFAESARFLPNVSFIFVGGTSPKIKAFKNKYQDSNIHFLGHKPFHEVPKYLKAADVLVLPNSGKSFGRRTTHSLYDTSPIKMFEYMASGVPIVASRLPSIEEVLNEKNAILVEPDNSKNLAAGIERVLDYPSRATQAIKDVEGFTWQNRARTILLFISKRS
ncbi:hypothetical protein CL654_02930 [bacterium]|nr:hypothetical protein [bacterium]|tara:strand:- start:35890 stop:37011 length:1122 start_codon:yes stop_codon:yes gene_type:complete